MTISMKESIGQHHARSKAEGQRKPLVSLTEFAAQQGVNVRYISGKLSRSKTRPTALVQHKGTSGSWYDKDELAAWWKTQAKKEAQ